MLGEGTLVEQFKLSPIGQVIQADIEKRKYNYNSILDAYVNDYVFMTHPCYNTAEHMIVGLYISRHMKKLDLRELNMVHVNLVYNQMKTMFENMSAVFSLKGNDSNLFSLVKKEVQQDRDEGKESQVSYIRILFSKKEV